MTIINTIIETTRPNKRLDQIESAAFALLMHYIAGQALRDDLPDCLATNKLLKYFERYGRGMGLL